MSAIHGFHVQPMTCISMRYESKILRLLYDFEIKNGIDRFIGGGGGPEGETVYYKNEDATKVIEFLQSVGLSRLSYGRLYWDRLDQVERQNVIENEKNG